MYKQDMSKYTDQSGERKYYILRSNDEMKPTNGSECIGSY